MWLFQPSVIVMCIYSVYARLTEAGSCLINEDCPSDKICVQSMCVNPCGDQNNCIVENHTPYCSSTECSSGGSDAKRQVTLANMGEASNMGEKKFRIYKDKLNWFGALLNCSSQGLSLATVNNQTEQDRLVHQMKQDSPQDATWWALWLGMSDLHKEGQFIWYSTGEPMTYSNFAPGEPNNVDYGTEKENCVAIHSGEDFDGLYRWNDRPCSMESGFACEYFE